MLPPWQTTLTRAGGSFDAVLVDIGENPPGGYSLNRRPCRRAARDRALVLALNWNLDCSPDPKPQPI